MPELPDVQVFREYADEHAVGRTVSTVSFRPAGMTATTSGSTLRDAFRGHRVRETHRHGKHLFLRSGEDRGRWLRLHFGMTGSLRAWSDDGGEAGEPDHTRLRFDFERGDHLAFRCPRKLGEIGLVDDPGTWIQEKGLGPDPFSEGFGLRDFRSVLEGRSGTVKGTLMNQEVLAGLGNIYTDEALFQASVHPEVSTDDLGDDRVEELWRSVKKVLEKAIDYRVDVENMPHTWLLPNREDGADCPRCDGTIRKVQVSGRSTYFCDRHQRKG